MSTPNYAGIAQQQEQNRQNLITQGTQNINKAFSGFDQNFYNQRAQAYQDYAMPQLAQQYDQMKGQVGFNLANRGLYGSSTGNKQYSDLNQQMGVQKQAIADTGRSQAQALQNQVQSQQNALLGQLYQSADPTSAAQAATNTAASFQAPQAFAPLGNMFANLANQYYQSQLINAYRPTSYVSLPQGQQSYGSAGALPGVTQ
jgi:hypothetical protein